MLQNFFHLLNHTFRLMAENKLRKDIDDTLLEKLLTLLKKLKESKEYVEVFSCTPENKCDISFDFIEELLTRTEVSLLIEKVLLSTVNRNDNHPILIKSFVIRLLGLIFSPKKFYSYEHLLPLLKCTDGNMMYHPPSIQDALLDCLSCVTKEAEGAIWFIDQNLIDFVFSSFNSSSYYVRKSSVNFVIAFISQWMNFKPSDFKLRKLEENYVEKNLKNFIYYIVRHIHFYKNSKEIVFAQCCISVLKQLLALQNIENLLGDQLEFSKSISECFVDLAEDAEFNKKLADLFLAVYFKLGLSTQSLNDVIKCLIIKEDIKLVLDLTSSFVSTARRKESCCSESSYSEQMMFFLIPLHILINIPPTSSENFFTVKADLVYNIISQKMEDKLECKTLVSSSLNALQKVTPHINSDSQKTVGKELLELVMHSSHVYHKWFYSVLEDRNVHHAFTELYSTFLLEEVYITMRDDESDLVFQNIIQFLKKPTSDNNFLSQLLLLMKDVLVLHEKYEFELAENERIILTEVLCRMLHDNRESVVDSALHLAGQMIIIRAFQSNISEKGIHSIIWDIAIQGNHDGAIRSTALKVIIIGCLDTWCLDEMKVLKGITETDIVKILFDLTFDADFFLQREALSSLFEWMKSKWNDLQISAKEYLLSALLSAIKSLDLEQKLISLKIWLWILENKFTFASISPTFDVKQFVEYLTNSGFGLSMILALEDYDPAVQFKAAEILCKLQTTLKSRGISFDSLTVSNYNVNGSEEFNNSDNLVKIFTKEEKDKGIDNVMEISTTDQITNICRSGTPEFYDFKQEYFLSNDEDRKCTFSSFWICLWSENITSILKTIKSTESFNTFGESLLNDIISARIVEYDSVEDTPDCY